MHNILLVDFNRHACGELQKLLGRYRSDYAIGDCVVSAQAALLALAEREFSVVLVNTGGCAAAGLWVCHYIRKKSQIPILFMGGVDHFRLVRKALAYQVSDYLPGPVRASALLNSLDQLKLRLDAEPAKRFPSTFKSPIHLEGKHLHSGQVIKIVKAYVRDHLSSDITLKKISDMLHFNCAYLGQKFKMEENISFNHYLMQQRMEKAKLLLISTNLRIYEIASEVGYTDTDWFYKKFRAYTGESPNVYRKQQTFTA
ncbi:helix-turn-helix domain-containing protein [Paenibacillus sp. E222]|uniref:helix-turn-helix domain-containing protein n=1 Tax=Paenibacillus sp. E222 TaxID=2748863 RepID=UPI0015C5C64A|nr:helix-turn-helix domain-containing protein [Paenibacillus sp. E222]QLG40177.1 helix-turn-helix domain-containing protein [Paenibacillus sp. E222]